MSDHRLLAPTRWTSEMGPLGFTPVECVDVVAGSKDGVVHAVKIVSDGYNTGWELGQWRMLTLYCEQRMKHHPKKLDRSATGAVTCLGCVANGGVR